MNIPAEEIRESTINDVFDQREKYLIIGLTGKNGSGCSTTARIFSEPMQVANLSCPEPGLTGMTNDLNREIRIIQRYAKWHQKKFEILKVRDIIASFLLENEDSWNRFIRDYNVIKKNEITTSELWTEFMSFCQKQRLNISSPINKIEDAYERNKRAFSVVGIGEIGMDELEYVKCFLPCFAEFIHEKLGVAYTDLFQKYGNEIRFWGTLSTRERGERLQAKDKFYRLRERYLQEKKNQSDESAVWPIMMDAADKSKKILVEEADYYNLERKANTIYTIAERVNRTIKIIKNARKGKPPVTIVIDSMKNIYESNYLKERYSAFYLISITKEENIRLKDLQTSRIGFTRQDIANIDYNERPGVAKKNLSKFVRIFEENWRKYIENYSIRDLDIEELNKYFHAIIKKDERRLWNYVKDEENTIHQGLARLKKMIYEDNNSNLHNYSGMGEMLIASEYEYYLNVICDPLRVFLYISNLYAFYAQDVETCIQNSDIFLTNNEQDGKKSLLRQNILKYVSLMLHPGLVPPTPVERCMQIAYTAKINSGCISRQVGAVVTDANYQILSLSWNDVPCGQTSCVYRNMIDLYRQNDLPAYSDYEIDTEDEFQKYLKRTYDFPSMKIERVLNGLPGSYCFKDAQEKITGNRNPMDARSMHGEEKALLACDQQRVRGGFLFTTSSPCEMCAKNAKEHQISKIYYIEPYPGISQKNICDSGTKANRAEYVLFEGAIGRAYNQLYTPIIPYKDELKLRGFPDDFIHSQEQGERRGLDDSKNRVKGKIVEKYGTNEVEEQHLNGDNVFQTRFKKLSKRMGLRED